MLKFYFNKKFVYLQGLIISKKMCAAPKGNNYWQFRGKHGRNFKYTPEELWEEAIKYFDWISSKVWNKKEAIKTGDLAGTTMDVPIQTPMSIDSFCLFADIGTDTFRNYESNKKGYEDFFEVTTRIRKIIESNQFEGAVVGVYNPNIIARKLGLSDKQEIDHTTKGKEIVSVNNFKNLSLDDIKKLEELSKKIENTKD